MDYQSNNQSGDPQNTGEPYNNTPVNNEDPYNNTNTPANNRIPYENGSGNVDPRNVPNQGNLYNNAQNTGNPYDNMQNNGNPHGNMQNNANPYGSMQNTGNPYGNMHNNGNPYGNPYNNTNPYNNQYNTPYNNRNPYGNQNPYGNVNANIIYPQKTKGEGMATAAMVLGIISLISLVLLRIYIPFLLGGVGIILAVLSKGNAKKMLGKAKAGFICCITGLVLDIALCISSVYLVFALPDLMPELMDEVNKVCEEQYGVSYDEMMDEIYEMWDIER